jgi:Subtilase family/Secretion system C-terminal sorting domain
MKKYTLFFIHCLMVCTAQAQESTDVSMPDGAIRRSGEMLVRIAPDEIIGNLAANLRRRTGYIFEGLSCKADTWRIYKLRFDEAAVTNVDALLKAVQQAPGVQAAQWNRKVEERDRTPNDPEWLRQDNMRLIGAVEAWDAGTGGVTATGDTIVVGVLELGLNINHADLAPNLWINRAEIPGNRVDDDNNGYIDDYLGYDIRRQGNAGAAGNSHGTSVNGIIGARGNNNLGVAGVNWYVKLMNVSNTEYEDEIVGAYYYMASWRQRYNRSGGKDGAFVVAANASLGIDRQRAERYPIWCAVYDSLGKIGILGVASTTNRNVDVDVEGDMPTTCTSEFLMTTTNVSSTTDLRANAGYGATSIDMGAPGDGSFTTSNGTSPSGSYARFAGTSAAAPHVTGSIALLYGLGCANLTRDAITNPSGCARRVRDIIFKNTMLNNSLRNVTTTGGRLNLARAVEAVQDLCKGADRGALDILSLQPNPADELLYLRFQTPTIGASYTLRIVNQLGQLVYEDSVDVESFRISEKQITVTQWPVGMYIIIFGNGKGVVAKKFLKK